jgi:hypothetical protein
MAPAFMAVDGQIVDRLGNLWTVDEATQRLHLIADLLTEESELNAEIGAGRIVSLAAAIRQAKAQGAPA